MSRRSVFLMTLVTVGIVVSGESWAQQGVRPFGDPNEINLVYWYSTKDKTGFRDPNSFKVLIFDDRPIPPEQRVPGSQHGFNKQHYATQMAQYEIKYPGWQGATTSMRLQPGTGPDDALAQMAKEQVETEINRLKNVVKTRLGKMEAPQIPYQDVKPMRSEEPRQKKGTKFTYKEDASKQAPNLVGTRWNQPPYSDVIDFSPDGRLEVDGAANNGSWEQSGRKVSFQYGNLRYVGTISNDASTIEAFKYYRGGALAGTSDANPVHWKRK